MTEQEKEVLINDVTLYIKNDFIIYNNVVVPVCNSLARKKYKGVYEDKKAKKSWFNVVNYGLQRYYDDVYQKYYVDEYGYISAWHYLLSTSERRQVADDDVTKHLKLNGMSVKAATEKPFHVADKLVNSFYIDSVFRMLKAEKLEFITNKNKPIVIKNNDSIVGVVCSIIMR